MPDDYFVRDSVLILNFAYMKDLIIPGKLLKREFIIFCCCLLAAWLVDVYAVLKFNGHWTELFTQVGFVLTITIALYLLRLLVWGISILVKKILGRR